MAYWQRDYNRWWWRLPKDEAGWMVRWMDWNGILGRTIKQSWPHFPKRLTERPTKCRLKTISWGCKSYEMMKSNIKASYILPILVAYTHFFFAALTFPHIQHPFGDLYLLLLFSYVTFGLNSYSSRLSSSALTETQYVWNEIVTMNPDIQTENKEAHAHTQNSRRITQNPKTIFHLTYLERSFILKPKRNNSRYFFPLASEIFAHYYWQAKFWKELEQIYEKYVHIY